MKYICRTNPKIMNNAGKPINPIYNQDGFLTSKHSDKITEDKYAGLTKREYFAGLAMQGFLSNSNLAANDTKLIAEDCVIIADALLKALEPTPINP